MLLLFLKNTLLGWVVSLVLQHYWCGRGAFRSVGYGIVIVGFAGDAGNAISGGTSSTSAASGTSTNRYLCFSGCLMQ